MTCDFLQNALDRYWKILQQDTQLVLDSAEYRQGDIKLRTSMEDFIGYLHHLEVNLTGVCLDDEYPSLQMDESCKKMLFVNI